MIIDSKKYNKTCSCGREHTMTTKACIIDKGCMADLGKYAEEYGLSGYSVAVYDDNTYNAKNVIRPAAGEEIILPSKNLHADNHGVEMLMGRIPEKCDYLIAIGSGSLHDLVRYCAYERNIPFISCPTAASVDGFCSSVAAMTWNGYKKTLTAVSPEIVVADLDVISEAPMFLTKSGFGDMIGKFIALSEWKISNLLTGEFICNTIYDMTMDATKAVIESADGIKNGDKNAYEKLIYGLLMSGLAMQLLGNSRCASGAEHHISHFIEMEPAGLNAISHALHGEKVGVGTLLAAEVYHGLKDAKSIEWGDYVCADDDYIGDMFGEKTKDSVVEENRTDMCAGITAKEIEDKWEGICKIINEIPTVEELKNVYSNLGIKSTLKDIEIPDNLKDTILEYSPLVRNRLTLMRLRRAIKK